MQIDTTAAAAVAVDRKRNIGLAVGSLWLVVAGVFFASFSLLAIGTADSRVAFGATVALTLSLVSYGAMVLRGAMRLPALTSGPSTSTEDRTRARRFGLTVLTEILAFAVLNPLMASRGHIEVLVAMNLVIVGLHFLPLAWLFQVPRYYVMGALFCVIPAMTLLSVPQEQHIGAVFSWYVVPALGCGLVAALTGATGLVEVQRATRSAAQSR